MKPSEKYLRIIGARYKQGFIYFDSEDELQIYTRLKEIEAMLKIVREIRRGLLHSQRSNIDVEIVNSYISELEAELNALIVLHKIT